MLWGTGCPRCPRQTPHYCPVPCETMLAIPVTPIGISLIPSSKGSPILTQCQVLDAQTTTMFDLLPNSLPLLWYTYRLTYTCQVTRLQCNIKHNYNQTILILLILGHTYITYHFPTVSSSAYTFWVIGILENKATFKDWMLSMMLKCE